MTSEMPPAPPPPVVTSPSPITLPEATRAVTPAFQSLNGWAQDDACTAFDSFRRSCPFLLKRGTALFDGKPVSFTRACASAEFVNANAPEHCRTFFETWFRPVQVTPAPGENPLFTGYYETSLAASRVKTAEYRYPIYRLPKPVSTLPRSAIEQGALAGKGLEIAYANDPVALYFLHVQGSGRLQLPDGDVIHVGFAGKNGQDYTSIGKILIERGVMPPGQLDYFSLRDWMQAHPREARDVMWQNRSFIFFRETGRDGPIGSLGVPLTAERSLAIDRASIPLGAPLWVETELHDGTPFRKLMFAQDTGSAIKGRVRGDIFFGYGDVAEQRAGRMKQPGRYTILLPVSQ